MNLNYPDTANYVLKKEGVYNDNTGYVEIGDDVEVTCMGRYDANYTKGYKDSLEQQIDSSSIIPSFAFYMPKTSPVIPIGTLLNVYDASAGLTFSGVVQFYNKGLFNSYVICANG